MKNIIFFNHFHNGDVHVSRGFIRKIIDKVKTIDPSTHFSYAHKNDYSLLLDIDNLSFNNINGLVSNEHVPLVRKGNTILINTWYAQDHHKYMNQHDITFDCLYSIFDQHCKDIWNFSLEEISKDPADFFPWIDFNHFNTYNTVDWLQRHKNKKVFVSNGAVLSGQADNFNLTNVIQNLAQRYRNVDFILTNVEGHQVYQPNIYYSSNIIKAKGCDLNENAFLSTHCDVIVGRASGTFTFAFIKENLFIRNPKFICFSNLNVIEENKFWLHNLMKNKINYNAKIINRNESNVLNVEKIIEESLV